MNALDSEKTTPASVLARIKVFEAAGGAVTLNLTADDWLVIKASLSAVSTADRKMRDIMLSYVASRMRQDHARREAVSTSRHILMVLVVLMALCNALGMPL